jgi:hypothetical protein
MNIVWWIGLIGFLVVYLYAQIAAGAFVQKLTGREPRRPESSREASLYRSLTAGLPLAIAIPPIYLLPHADPLVIGVFFALGGMVGELAAQAFFGRKIST